MTKSTTSLLLIGSLFFVGNVLANEGAADPAAFEQKKAACGACHGEKGDKPLAPEYPIIAGQHADYLAASLRHYRDGRRNNAIMAAQVQALQLTESDIVGLADYFSKQASPLKTLSR